MPQLSTDDLRAYLREIGRVPMLTHEEEITLGKAVHRWQQLEAAIAPELKKGMELWQAELLNGLKPGDYDRAAKAGKQAKDKMVRSNLRLVVSIAKKYQDRGLELLDLIAEGNLGLIRGVEKFDPYRGFKFSTFGYWWIRQSLTRGIAEKSRNIRLPVHISEKLNRRKRAIKELATEIQRLPTPEEIADRMSLPIEDYNKLMRFAQNTMSLDMLVGNEQDTTLGDLLAAEEGEPVELIDMRKAVDRYMGQLNDKEALVLTYRYGLDDGVARTLGDIGKLMGGISRERVRQLESRALQKIRGFERRSGRGDRALLG